MPLILVRHGQTEWNLAKKMQSWRDSKLTPGARKQLVKMASIDCDVIYTSDLGRAMATARYFANKLPQRPVIRVDRRLRERNFGILTNHLKGSSAMPAHYWLAYQNRYQTSMEQVPQVEHEQEFEQRIRAFIGDINGRHPEQKVLAVSHGEWIRAALNIAKGKSSWLQGNGIPDNGAPVLINAAK